MVNPRGGGQQRGRGGFNAPYRRDGSVPGQKQASRSSSQGRGSSRDGRGEGGGRGGRGGGGDGRGRGHHQASGSSNSQRERWPDERAQGTRGGGGGGDGRGRGQRRGEGGQHHHGRPNGNNSHRPMIRGGFSNASSPSRGFGRPIHGLMHQRLTNYLLPAPLISSSRPENPHHQQASGSMTDVSAEEPQRGRAETQRGRGGNGRGRGRGRDGTPEVRRLGYKTLEGLLEKEASEVAITLSTSTGLKNLLDDDTMRSDLVQLVCQVLCKAFGSRIDRKTVLHLARVVKDSRFFRNFLPYYVTGMMTDYTQARREHYPQYLSNIISLLSEVLNMFPQSSIQSVSMLVALLKTTINQLRASGVDILDSTDEDLERVQGLVNHLQEKSREGTLRSDNYSFLAADEDAPPGEEDFRTMSIYPTIEEFHLDQKPFLRPNIMSQSFPNARIYLDTHFRLLREDFVRPLREGVKEVLRSQHNTDGIPMKKRQFDDIRLYHDTRLILPLCTSTGIAYKVQFDPRPLQFVRWENSKRLLYGSLVCLSMDNFQSFLFATVTDRDPKLLRKGQVHLCFSSDSRASLASVQPSDSFLMVETTAYFEAYRYVLEGLQEQDENDVPFERYIVQCNTNVDPPAYLRVEGRSYDLSSIMAEGQEKIPPFNPLTPHAWPDEEKMGLDESQLKALKLALTNELAIIQGPPGTGKTHVGLRIAQALLENHTAWSNGCPMLVVCYTNHALDQFLEGIHRFLKTGIVRVGGRSNSEILKPFGLRELTRVSNFRKSLPQHLRRAHHEIYTQMEAAEELLKRQSAQLECSLRGVLREDFLERYISEQHWDSLSLQPAWEEYETVGKKKPSMITEWLGIGSNFFMQGPQLTEMADEDGAQLDDEELIDIDEEADLIEAERIVVDADHGDKDWKKLKREEKNIADMAELMLAMNLNETEPQGPAQNQAQTNQGEWQMQSHQKKKMKQMAKKELRKTSAMSEQQERQIRDIWSLNLKDRWRLYRLWILRYRTELRAKALTSEQVYQDAAERLNEIRRREDLCVLRQAQVVGMTTTGAAKYRQALQELQPRLVIVEEAAEVLEAHTITTLSKACQHLILIGDHQQLRPSATVYELAKNFNLEVSMFERLVGVNFPFVRLNYQHRMRPSIARLLTPHIYDTLENHPSVLEYENVKGLLENLYFVEHCQLEEEIKDGRSHQNTHEAHFVVALCRYLLLQDYEPSQITILTTYTGQLHCLRKLMPSTEFSGVKVHVVDKYQGEENDIIILSLVRSNLQKRVGFLNISNRVCVALSRAKMGLYCIGNMDMLSSVKLWSNIIHTLRERNQVGRALTLSCQNHPDKQILASCSADFKGAPEGGCDQPCQFRLDCGHVCTRMCHPYDADHKKFKCMKDCQKVLCELEHKCTKRCYQECGKCRVLLDKTIPSCQHIQKVPCHQDPATFVCQEHCQKTLPCSHPCKAACGESCITQCMVRVQMQLKCGHVQEEPCYISTDHRREPHCRTKCGTTLKCGHPCPGTCHGCCQGRLHKACSHKCQQILVCSHQCWEPCVRDCPPCSVPCENRCVHSICKKACGQPCAPCMEPCEWQCPHHSCTKLCHEPCDRPPCSVPCNNTLPCGHRCIGLCGDRCPDKCRICHKDEVMEIFFGNEDDPDACFIQLEDCNHLFETTGMDQYMNLDENQDAELDQRAIKLKECPRCRTPIRRNLRYGTHINRSLAAIEMVKEKINGVPHDIEQQQEFLILELLEKKNLRNHLPKEFTILTERLEKKDPSLQQLWHLENLMNFLESVGKLKANQADHMTPNLNEIQPFSRKAEEVIRFLLNPTQRFSDQQVADLERELKRLSYLAELDVRCGMSRTKSIVHATEIQQLRDILEDNLPFSEGLECTVKQMFTDLDTKLPRSGLGITDEERVMVLKAVGLSKGHWYKCPNGHVYAIGECGGAMEKAKCPECDAAIGGTNHNLIQDNAVATEMDGAKHGAWSDAANLANFDRENFEDF